VVLEELSSSGISIIASPNTVSPEISVFVGDVGDCGLGLGFSSMKVSPVIVREGAIITSSV